jgi:hypothetical protein
MSTSKTDMGTSMLVAIIAAFLSFSVYLLTLSQSVGWHDSAELALVAWQFGASHAPGSPIHSALGHFMMQFYAEPHKAVILLSALTASATAGILALLIYMLKKNAAIALFSALVYALSYQVWAGAVMTEIYSLSILFLSIALLNVWLWQDSGRSAYLIVWIIAYALSLGAYFANILLFPAFAYLIYRRSARQTFDQLIFSSVVGLTVVFIGMANYLLAQNALPFGEIVPDSVMNMVLYMSGSQHAPLEIRDAEFVLTRLKEHLEIFSRSIFYLGLPLGLLGAFSLTRMNKIFGHFMALIFATYMVYYTVFGPGDYFMMVLPAYFVYAVWIALGVLWLISYVRSPQMQWVCRLLPVFVAGGLLAIQFDGRRLMAQSLEAEDFATATFELLPDGAVAIAGWGEYATLRYSQEVHGIRSDIKFLVPARSIRHYPHGEVTDYVDLVGSSICAVPVFTTKDLPDLGDQYQLQVNTAESPWMRVTGASGVPPEFCR